MLASANNTLALISNTNTTNFSSGSSSSSSPTFRIKEAAELMGERETAYFGASPFTLLDAVGASIVEAYAHLEQRFPHTLASACPFLTSAQVQAITQAWMQLVEAAVDRNFELFEMYCLRNVFQLPPGYLLPYERIGVVSAAADGVHINAQQYERLVSDLQAAREEESKLADYQGQLGTRA